MKLVDGWQSFWRWNSVQLFAILAVIPPVWAEMPVDVKDYLPEQYRPWIMGVMAMCGIVARLRSQE